MTTKELIKAEIDNLSEEDLEELHELIRNFARTKGQDRKESLLSKLQSIQIDAPEDFAANLDLYVSGEKREG